MGDSDTMLDTTGGEVVKRPLNRMALFRDAFIPRSKSIPTEGPSWNSDIFTVIVHWVDQEAC